MLRWSLRLLLLSLLLSAVGFTSNAYAVFEVIRVAGGVAMTVGLALLIVWYVRTPQPPPEK
jgi:hypothetical protein